MELKLIRKDFGADHTIGDLLVNGKFECYILEDVVRPKGEKVYGKTAIPYGKYNVDVTMSNRFKKMLPLLLLVPGFEGIRIHPGNTSKDTEGCLLPGTDKRKGMVLNSQKAFHALIAKITGAIDTGEKVTIEVVQGQVQNFV